MSPSKKRSNPKARYEDIHPKEHIADMTTITVPQVWSPAVSESSAAYVENEGLPVLDFGPSSFRDDMKLALVVILPHLYLNSTI